MRLREIGSSHGVRHLAGTLPDGREAFVKQAPGGARAAELAAEASGLRWLAEAGAVAVPEVFSVDEDMLVIEMLPPGRPAPQAARDFGAALARLHAAGAPSFGAPWPGSIAGLPSGNVWWSGGQAWLIDPAAHGGHRETDLAMLALFGAPFLAEILHCYDSVAPLADGWRARVPLHQLHPLLVHACLYGAGYGAQAGAAARAVLAA